jgi:hypothetical protein
VVRRLWQNAPVRVVDDRVGEAAAAPATTARPAGRARRATLIDVAAIASYLALALAVLARLWADPQDRVLTSNEDDHAFFSFMLAHAERVAFHLENPLFITRLNVPDGVNVMANTSVLALGLPAAPVTHFLGVGVTVVLLLTLGLSGTAAAWYWVLSRHLVRSRAAAYVGGLWCGFAPTMVSHANGHINFASQFLVPFIVWRALRLREPGGVVRNGAVLAGLIIVQVFVAEEVLLFTALALGVFVAAYAAMDRAGAGAVLRPFAAGLGVAAGIAVVVLAYPLWFQFFGPGHYRGQPFSPDDYVTDLAAFGAFARQSLAGDAGTADRLSVSATEDNAFFGWPVLLVLAVAVVLLRRSVAARATAVVGLVFAVASLGPTLVVNGADTGIPMPFWLASRVPILDLVSVTRFTMVTSMVVGVLLALAADRMTARGAVATGTAGRPGGAAGAAGTPGTSAGPVPAARRAFTRPVRVAFWVALVAALVPVAPTPLPTAEVPPLPAFFANGRWKDYVPEGRTLVPVPLPDVTTGRQGMRWATMSGFAFAMPRGYFMGPADPPDDITGSWSAPPRPTSDLLRTVVESGRRPVIGPVERQAAVGDLTFWRAAVVVLGEHPRHEVLRAAVTDLLGRQPVAVDGVLLWDVRDLPVPPTR